MPGMRTQPLDVRRSIDRMRWLLTLAAGWLVLLSVLPAVAPELAARAPDHAHLTLSGVVPAHHHVYDRAPSASGDASCGKPDRSLPSTADGGPGRVVCGRAMTADSASMGVLALGNAAVAISAALTLSVEADWSSPRYAEPAPRTLTPPPRA